MSGLADLVPIGVLAKRVGKCRNTMKARLKALAAKDPDGGKWLIKINNKFFVNLSLMRASHPEFFEAVSVSRFEFATYVERLVSLEKQVANLRAAIRSQRQ